MKRQRRITSKKQQIESSVANTKRRSPRNNARHPSSNLPRRRIQLGVADDSRATKNEKVQDRKASDSTDNKKKQIKCKINKKKIKNKKKKKHPNSQFSPDVELVHSPIKPLLPKVH